MSDFTHIMVIPEDNSITVDGETMRFEFVKPEGIRAIQWHGTAANSHIEKDDYSNAPATKALAAEYFQLFQNEKARRKRDALELSLLPPPPDTRSPEEKRRDAYAAEADGFFQQYQFYQAEADGWEALGDAEKATQARTTAAEHLRLYVLKKEEIRNLYPDITEEDSA